MNWLLKRDSDGYTPDGVFGTLTSEDGAHSFCSLEHSYLGQAKLAVGTYVCQLRMSPHLGYMVYQIMGVPDFQGQPVSYIEIHIGNTDKDSEGCVLLGLRRDHTMILGSKNAFDQFMTLQAKASEFTLVVA